MASNFKNMVITLLAVTLVSALALGYVYEWTKAPIAEARLATQLKAIAAVLKDYDNNPVDEQFLIPGAGGDSLACFPARRNKVLTGVAIKTFSGKGYSGEIWLMVGMDTMGTVQNIAVLQHQETPGLGSKISAGRFQEQFLGLGFREEGLHVKKDGGTIDAISGATISSRAFCDAVYLAQQSFLEYAASQRKATQMQTP